MPLTELSEREVRLGGWSFHIIDLDDKRLYEEYIRKTEYPANLWSSNFAYLWAISQSNARKILWKIVDGMLVTFAHSYKDSLYLRCLPFGRGDADKIAAVLKRCMEFCDQWNGRDDKKTVVMMVNEAQLDFLLKCPDFDRTFRVVTWKGIERHYDVGKLSQLSGGSFAAVRNRVNKFRRENPDAVIRPYRQSDYEGLLALAERWKQTSGRKYSRVFDDLYYREIVNNCGRLGQKILVAEKRGHIIGMVSGSELPTGQAWGSLIKFEEGFPGLSETLIVEFAREIHRTNAAVSLMNVGSDLGEGGLRNYKMKFNPVLNYKRYEIHLRRLSV